MNTGFDHEKLTVYQEAVRFVAWADKIVETLPKGLAVHGQLDRASTSLPLVGLIRSTSPDRVHEQGAVYESNRQGLGD
jgi:hypothetical protein